MTPKDTGYLRAEIMAYERTVLCAECDHPRVHHFGATDGRKAAPMEPGCWVYIRQKRQSHECKCSGWRARG